MHCDFCGFDFDPTCSITAGCTGCPIAKSCTKITCPRCGYQMLPESKLVGWLRKLRENKKLNKSITHGENLP